MRVHIDLETRSGTDIQKKGLRNYVADTFFETLLLAMAYEDGSVQQWEGIPADFPWQDPSIEWHAFNAPFEIAALAAAGYPIPLERWRCTMTHAYARGFAGDLADVGAALGLEQDKVKMVDGARLIKKFCVPYKGNLFRQPENEVLDWEFFKEYNHQDVIAERAIYKKLSRFPMSPEEIEIMHWDWWVNAKGLPIDMNLVTNAIHVSDLIRHEIDDEMKKITGGVGAGQVAKLLEWCKKRGYWGGDLRADNIRGILK